MTTTSSKPEVNLADSIKGEKKSNPLMRSDINTKEVGIDEIAMNSSIVESRISTASPITAMSLSTTGTPFTDITLTKEMKKQSPVKLDLLLDHVRKLNNLPVKEEERHKIDYKKPPIKEPRPTFTSFSRKQLLRYRMIVQCGNLPDKYEQYANLIKSPAPDSFFRELRDMALAKNLQNLEDELEYEDFERKREMATKALEQPPLQFRETASYQLRAKFTRGEPIISNNFRQSYRAYERPPFVLTSRFDEPKIYKLPPIDKNSEVWLVPLDTGSERFNLYLNTPDFSSIRKSSKKDRLPLKPGKRIPMSERKELQNRTPTKRPSWSRSSKSPYKICSYSY